MTFEDPRYFQLDRQGRLVADDPEKDWRKRSWPRLALVASATGGAAIGSAAALPLGALTGLEPLPWTVPLLALVGATIGVVAARRTAHHDLPALDQIGQLAAAHLVIALAAALAAEAPYVHWLRRTAKDLAATEWKLLAGTPASELRATLGEPQVIEHGAAGEHWLYERRFGRLKRHWMRLEVADGRLVASQIADHRGWRYAIWVRPPEPPE